MKKFIFGLFLLIFSFNLFINIVDAQETRGGICSIENITTEKACKDAKGVWVADYNYLAPLGDEQGDSFNPAQKNALSKYLNTMIKVIIGIAAVLAVIMIVMGGIQYMTSELISSKEEGKKRITNAVFGLFIAIGAYLILFTINPNLLKLEPDSTKFGNVAFQFSIIDVPLSEGGDLTETPITSSNVQPTQGGTSNCSEAGKAYCMFGNYAAPKPTGQIPQLIALLKSDPGYRITKINVYTNDRIWFTAEKGSEKKMYATTGFGHGRNGFSEIGRGTSGDKKTPKGDFTITRKRPDSGSQMKIMKSIPDGYPLGAAVFNLGGGGIDARGVAIHGNKKNGNGSSAGCILMSNDDLVALYPYISVGTKVIVR